MCKPRINLGRPSAETANTEAYTRKTPPSTTKAFILQLSVTIVKSQYERQNLRWMRNNRQQANKQKKEIKLRMKYQYRDIGRI